MANVTKKYVPAANARLCRDIHCSCAQYSKNGLVLQKNTIFFFSYKFLLHTILHLNADLRVGGKTLDKSVDKFYFVNG